MTLAETALSFLEEDCLRFFKSEGAKVFQQTEARYQDLLRGEDEPDSAAIQEHLRRNLFPAMAFYQTLREREISQEKALEYVRRETRRAAESKRERMRKLAGFPFTYRLYRMTVKRYMKKFFPEEGWRTEWVRRDGQEIHFNLHRCIYWDLTNAHGCPELCRVYCENDDIVFSGLLPKIRFERSGTLGGGAQYCDFHFLNTACREREERQ